MVFADKTVGLAALSGARRPADTMNVTSCLLRQVIVIDMRNIFYVKSACYDIGRYEYLEPSGLHIIDYALAFTLTDVAGKPHRKKIIFRKLPLQHLYRALHITEYYRSLDIRTPEECHKHYELFFIRRIKHLLIDLIDRNLLRLYLDNNRVGLHVTGRQPVDILIDSGREKHGLTVFILWQTACYIADIRGKAHIKHTVGLVYDKYLDIFE